MKFLNNQLWNKIIIYESDKETGKNYRIAAKFEITEEELELIALNWFNEHYYIDKEKNYEAKIDETII